MARQASQLGVKRCSRPSRTPSRSMSTSMPCSPTPASGGPRDQANSCHRHRHGRPRPRDAVRPRALSRPSTSSSWQTRATAKADLVAARAGRVRRPHPSDRAYRVVEVTDPRRGPDAGRDAAAYGRGRRDWRGAVDACAESSTGWTTVRRRSDSSSGVTQGSTSPDPARRRARERYAAAGSPSTTTSSPGSAPHSCSPRATASRWSASTCLSTSRPGAASSTSTTRPSATSSSCSTGTSRAPSSPTPSPTSALLGRLPRRARRAARAREACRRHRRGGPYACCRARAPRVGHGHLPAASPGGRSGSVLGRPPSPRRMR